MQHNEKVLCFYNTVMRAAGVYSKHAQLPKDFVIKFIGSAMSVCEEVVNDNDCEWKNGFLERFQYGEDAMLALDDAMQAVTREYCYVLAQHEICEIEFEMLSPPTLLFPY